MFDIALRRLKDEVAAPMCQSIPSNVSPGHLTLIAFLAGLAACFAGAVSNDWVYPVSLWLLNRLLDCLDGSLARARGTVTELGGFLDLLSDFITYSLLPISVAFGQERSGVEPDWRAIAVLEASFHINNFVLFYIAAVASKRTTGELTSVTMWPALVEGFESGVLFTAMLIWPDWVAFISWVMAAAVFLGTAQRVVGLIPVLRRLDSQSTSLSKGKQRN
ncbi:hypothetical protein MMC30_001574 [Trapelia coarctata]|nr:hypothetical protein [Trapelia coarctata]